MKIQPYTQICVALISLIASSTNSFAADYYVSPGGSDGASGSIGSPWRTFAKAATTASAGDTVYFRGGNYGSAQASITRSGTTSSPITFRNYDGETPILNGSGVSLTTSRGLINITNSSNVTIQGFDIRNYWSGDGDTPAGIWVWGSSQNIKLLDNKIHDLGSTHSANSRNAHGIAVYGTSATAISITISGNELYDLQLGNSESLVVNGNVNGFTIANNTVRDCDNIGIDCIGFEGIGSGSNDQARNGVISGNTVYNIDTRSNPSYNSASAAGIYVDGGKDIVIERNFVSDCNYGVEIASEHGGRTTSNITVRNNIIEKSHLGGLAIGGFSSSSSGAGGGATANCNIYNNTFYNNDDPSDDVYFRQIYFQYRVNNCNFRNNVFYKTNAEDGNNVFMTQWNNGNTSSGNQFNHNIFYSSGGDPVFVLEDDWLYTFNMYVTNSASSINVGGNELFLNPLLGNPTSGNFTLNVGSPAINSGDTSFSTSGEFDYAGNTRVASGIVDRGALEFGSSNPANEPIELNTSFSNGQLQLTWPTNSTFNYDLESTTNLTNWYGVNGYVNKSGTGSADSYSVPLNSPRQFFRLKRYDPDAGNN